MKSTLLCSLTAGLALGLSQAHGAITTALTQSSGTGSNIDVTSGTFATWGYATGSLGDGFDNFQSGDSAAVITNPTGDSTRDWGYTFSFDDGNSPTTGTSVALSGGQKSLLNNGPEFTLDNIVTSETQTLTLYLGGWGSSDTAGVLLDVSGTLTNADNTSVLETGTLRKFDFVSSGTKDVDGLAIATYTMDFSHASATDLRVNFDFSNESGSRNWSLAAYTVTVPEPSSYALLAGMLGLTWVMLRRRQG